MALVGGYALPINIGIGYVAIPLFIVWNRTEQRDPSATPERLLDALAWLGWCALTLALAGIVTFYALVIRSIT